VRTLPLRLSPLDGESLPGYVARYSHTFALQPGDVVRALGLDGGAGSLMAAGRYGVSLSTEQLQRAARASGLGSERLEAMLLARFAGRAFAGPSASAPVALAGEVQAHEVFVWSSRFCPGCLHDNGAWLLRWQLGWSVVCVRHRVLLARCCPKCATVPQIGRRAKWPRDRQGELGDPSRCTHRTRRGLCRASLAATKAMSVADDTALLSAQRRIDALLDGQLQPTLAGEELEPPAYLRDLRALANLLRNRGVPQARTSGDASRLLDDPGALASVLPEAMRLAELPDRAALAKALRELADLRYRADGQTLRPGRPDDVSAPLREALRRASSETVYATPSSQMGFDPRAHRRPDDLDRRLHARHVPQLFWAEDYERELSGLFDFDDFSAWLGRRFCSVLLARMLTPLDWHAAVRYLDLPERFINDGYNTTFVKLRRNGRFDELATRIKRLANERAEHELIDYKQRRAKLSDWTGIDPQTWLLLQPHPRPQTWRVDPPARRAHASVWLWCELTSGHERAAPVALPSHKLNDHTHFVHQFLAPLRERLLLLGELLLNTPAEARQTLPTRLAAVLHQRGYLAENFCLDAVAPLVASRVLAHTSAHTGVDIPTLTTPSRASPAVTHARLLAAALLRTTALASWAAITSTIGGHANHIRNNDHAYRAALKRTPTLAAELQRLARAVENWQTPIPPAPTTPHSERMHSIAETIRAHAAALLASPHGADLARRASILACRANTDLTWEDIAAIHNVRTAQPSFSRATITHHRRADRDFDHRYRRLLDYAQELQREAGFANASLTCGLTSKRTTARSAAVS
jgi:TniQ